MMRLLMISGGDGDGGGDCGKGDDDDSDGEGDDGSNDGDNDISKPRHIPSCALQLSIVLSRFSWNLLRICRLGEMRGTGVDCC